MQVMVNNNKFKYFSCFSCIILVFILYITFTKGFALDQYGVKCLNIDECSIVKIGGICGNGTCVDTQGSFRCECHAGFETRPLMTQVRVF